MVFQFRIETGPLKLAIFYKTHTIPPHNIKNHQSISCPGTTPPATPNTYDIKKKILKKSFREPFEAGDFL
ncbi:Protein of unknown function [Cotesia congregata]|uniref:Uncharacterized protein n=1 Tax=Cotesia congregata TaxID=51543 RepID=A0A8J2HC09_COTCN|nr:Protein of unknown function [Cotesia congregata]